MRKSLPENRLNLIVAFFLIFISLLLTAYSSNNPSFAKSGNFIFLQITAPIAKTFSFFGDGLQDYYQNYLNLINVRDQNLSLESQVANLLAENARLRESQMENDRLRKILKYAVVEQSPGIVAQVISYSNLSQGHTLTIDRGASDGVFVGQVAVDGYALLGQVVAVTKKAAKVLLISDPLSGVDSLSQDTRVRGIIQGVSRTELAWNFVPTQEPVNLGSRIITSGADGIFPKGLTIGVVLSVETPAHDLFHSIKIKPAADLARLENIFLLQGAIDASE